MFYVHRDIGHCGSINIIKSSHEGSIELLTSLEQLADVTTNNVESNIIRQIGAIYSLFQCLVAFSYL